MTDHEVERRLGYTPCVCGVLDGTWHPECYRNKTKEHLDAGYKVAFAKARRHLKSLNKKAAEAVIAKATQPPQ